MEWNATERNGTERNWTLIIFQKELELILDYFQNKFRVNWTPIIFEMNLSRTELLLIFKMDLN